MATARANTDEHGPTRTFTDSWTGGYCDDAQAVAGDQRVQAAEHGHHHVEELELRTAEVPPLEELAVQKPARHREMVEVAEQVHLEAGLAQLEVQHLLVVAAAMAEHLVERRVEVLPLRHVEHQLSPRLKGVVDVAQRLHR